MAGTDFFLSSHPMHRGTYIGPLPPAFQLFQNSGNCVKLGPMIRVPEQKPKDDLGEYWLQRFE